MAKEYWLKGTELSEKDQKDVLARFRYRYTGNHIPDWVKKGQTIDGKLYDYPLQFRDDADWLANSEFRVTAKGKLHNGARFCESHQTWPNGKDFILRKG